MDYCYRLIMLALVIVLMCSCNKEHGSNTDVWFEKTKKEILEQSDYPADSVNISYNDDSSFVRKCYYFQGRKMLLRGHHQEHLGGFVTIYSGDGNFEFRREVCRNGRYGFEGIFYRGESYGLSTWYHCSAESQLELQGVRFKNERIGVWKKWDEKGNLIAEIDYGRQELLDSLPQIGATYN